MTDKAGKNQQGDERLPTDEEFARIVWLMYARNVGTKMADQIMGYRPDPLAQESGEA